MTSVLDSRAKNRASSQPRDAKGRWSSNDAQRAKESWTNLRSTDGSPVSLPASDVASKRAQARQSSRVQSRASSVGGRSVHSIPEDSAIQQDVSPAPPQNENSVEHFDIALNDSPQQPKHGDLMDAMQNDLENASSVVSHSSSVAADVYQVASGLLQSMRGSNPYGHPYVLEKIAIDSGNDGGSGNVNVIPVLPFPSGNVPEAQSATAPVVDESKTNDEPVLDKSTFLQRSEFEEFKQ